MSPTIFFSWQSDLPAATTQDRITDALSHVTTELSALLITAPRLDRDTQGTAGSPEIAGTIFRKIERATVFVADVSLTSQAERKRSPNPNVMLETGYAAACLGWERIVLTMNSRSGGPSRLPFDLRHRRWPISFQDATSTTDLAAQLLPSIHACFAADYARAEDTLSQLSPHAHRMLQRLARATGITTNERGLPLSRDDYHIDQLIRMGLLRTVRAPTPHDFHSIWTDLGRECCRRLGIVLPPDATLDVDSPPQIVTDLYQPPEPGA